MNLSANLDLTIREAAADAKQTSDVFRKSLRLGSRIIMSDQTSRVNILISTYKPIMPNLYGSNIEMRSSDFSGGKPKSGEKGLYLFYADWCPHCNNPDFVSAWNDVHRVLKDKNIAVKALNCADKSNEAVCRDAGVQGFPTIMKLTSSGFKKYEGPRDKNSLVSAGSSQSGGAGTRRRRSRSPRKRSPRRRSARSSTGKRKSNRRRR